MGEKNVLIDVKRSFFMLQDHFLGEGPRGGTPEDLAPEGERSLAETPEEVEVWTRAASRVVTCSMSREDGEAPMFSL